MNKGLLLFIFGLVSTAMQAQPMAKNAFMNQDMQQAFDFWNISQPNTAFHSSFKPYLSSTYVSAADSMVPYPFYGFRSTYLSRPCFNRFQQYKSVTAQILPVVDIQSGPDPLLGKTLFSALGGMHVKLNIHNDFTFAGTLYGGKSQFPFFNDTLVRKQHIIPELGMAYGNSKSGYNFFDYMGYVSYSPKNNKIFNFQAGRDKHFIGDGYRSMLLSDYAAPYPFFRINTNVWRLQYNVWYSWMVDVSASGGLKQNFRNKFGTFHYLSFNILKELSLGLFENVIWRGSDTAQARGFDVNYLNPIIFFRPVEYSVGSPDNSFLGANLSANLFGKLKLYGQIGLDEFYLKEIRARRGWWANKQAWQLGVKAVNAFGIKGLRLQAEYNEARPFTYTHGLVDQNYGHYGMPLAHPMGANFRELIGIVQVHKKRWEFSWQGTRTMVGMDTAGTRSNIGQNLFVSYNTRSMEFGNKTTQGVKTRILQSRLLVTYYLKPEMNTRLEFGFIQRSESNTRGYELQNPFLYLSLKSSFWNMFKDN